MQAGCPAGTAGDGAAARKEAVTSQAVPGCQELEVPGWADHGGRSPEAQAMGEGSVDSGETLWVACERTMLGLIKSYIPGQERHQRAKCTQLEVKILELEGQIRHFDAHTWCSVNWPCCSLN
ncbi:hypothetical protein NDU88_003565 [Pleurodeles waltl]|uniref:Uncharacterized protein n=1 Tax=Pleurodeles waltl TaxID=8319 RepID=A0AAV7VEJ2_PLEWA|nr:hypothetical protein NDU88_003565 [Pleurodeles waltl]